MAWEQLSINRPHLVYIILGGFTSVFMLCSLFIKEKLYIGEATVATICGIIFGPHAADLINPLSWGNTDQITLEFSRIVLVVQCFAVGVELPKAYMERHWRSVVFLLVPVMTFGWLITSLFIWWLIVPLSWLESLAVAACVTATDPVLASSVVGKGKFAKRVPKHLRDILSAESGCNDGMAFPFIYLALYLIKYHLNAGEVTFHWICFTILYECIFGAVFGVCVGYIGRHAIKYAEKKGLIDRESFLVFYFVLALFCAGAGSMLGMDDLLIGFAAGVGFSNDGWFTAKTEESHVSNVIDLLINLSYFVYFGTIIPWDQYNAPDHGLEPWRLVCIAILVIFFRRIPAMLLLKPLIPDIKTWREALFAGHFGPIGVGAIFVAILARAELETGGTTPLAALPEVGAPDYVLIWTIWPIVTFLVIASIVVHGSSVAVFTLGKRINTLTITLSYTQDNERSSAWMNRLPRISSQSKSMSKMSDDFDSTEKLNVPPGQLPPIGIPKLALRRQREDEYEKEGSRPSSLRPYRRRKRRERDFGPGGPISQSAIMPARLSEQMLGQDTGSETLNEKSEAPSPEEKSKSFDAAELDRMKSDDSERKQRRRKKQEEIEEGKQPSASPSDDSPAEVEAYEEGHHLIIEDEEGNVLKSVETRGMKDEEKAAVVEATREKLETDRSGEYAKHKHQPHAKNEGKELKEEVEEGAKEAADHPQNSLRKALESWRGFGKHKGEVGEQKAPERKRGPAHAYQFGNTIIVEDEDGEVIKKYTLPNSEGESSRRFGYTNEQVRSGLQRMGTWVGLGKQTDHSTAAASGVTPENLRQHDDELEQAETVNEKGAAVPKAKPKKRDDDAISAISGVSDDGLRLTISRADRYGLTGLQKRKQFEGADDDLIGVGSGRRMSTKDFLRQMKQMDPKAKIDRVNDSDAPDDIKREVKEIARHEAASRPAPRRFETTPNKPALVRDQMEADSDDERVGRRPEPARSQSDMPVHGRPRPKRSNTAESMDSIKEENIPTHDIRSTVARRGQGMMTAAELRRQRLSTSQDKDKIAEHRDEEDVAEEDYETPAERRRRLAALGASSGDDEDGETPAERRRRLAALNTGSDDDEDEDIETPAERRRRLAALRHGSGDEDDEERETGPEKRRRLAALGIVSGDDSDSEHSDVDVPRVVPPSAVREPDEDPSPPRPAPKPRIQWGGESGRDLVERGDSESDVGETKGQKMSRKFKSFLNR